MMYSMLTKSGTVITKKHASSLEEAIDIFSKTKQLTRSQFLSIFMVEQQD